MGPLLDDLTFTALRADTLSVRLTDERRRSMAERRRDAVARLVSNALGRPIRIEFTRAEQQAPAAQPTEQIDQSAAELPLVRQAMDLFDARLIRVEEDLEPHTESDPPKGS